MAENHQLDAQTDQQAIAETQTPEPPKLPGSLREVLAQLDAEGVTDYRRYREVHRYLDFKAREKGVPISCTFELTPLCNLDCKMCYVHLNASQLHGAKLLPVETWKDIARQAFDAGTMYASITGGECLTYPGFKEFYLYLRSLGLETHILSNGLLMDEGMVDFLVANPPSLIQVTLYGASEDAYERVTGHRTFARVMGNIRRLREAGMPLSVAVTPNAFMTDGPEVVRLLHEEGFPFVINSGIVSPRDETGRDLADSGLDAYVAMFKLKKELTGSAVEPECEPDTLPSTADSKATPSEAPRGVRCGAGRSACSIDWRGRMRPCNTFPSDPIDVLELGFAQSWRITNQTAIDFSLPVECEGCSYQHACKSCVSDHASGAPCGHANPAICKWGKRMVAEGLVKL